MFFRLHQKTLVAYTEIIHLLMDAAPVCRPIQKYRYCVTYDNSDFEIDIYPFGYEQATVEIELADRHIKPKFPDYLEIIREVTGDEHYKNHSLAMVW